MQPAQWGGLAGLFACMHLFTHFPVAHASGLEAAVAHQQAGRTAAALEAFRQAAEAGSVEAQYHLAQSLLNGGLGTFNPAESEYWYGRVRESGLCPSTIRPPEDAVSPPAAHP